MKRVIIGRVYKDDITEIKPDQNKVFLSSYSILISILKSRTQSKS